MGLVLGGNGPQSKLGGFADGSVPELKFFFKGVGLWWCFELVRCRVVDIPAGGLLLTSKDGGDQVGKLVNVLGSLKGEVGDSSSVLANMVLRGVWKEIAADEEATLVLSSGELLAANNARLSF